MTDQSTNTEKIILEAARKVFIEKGKEGARMQEIADEAGINKALLHYYFRNKQRLFEAVFLEAFEKFLPQLKIVIESDKPFLEVIQLFIENYINVIIENPYLPGFILHELSSNPENLALLLQQRVNNMDILVDKINVEIQQGKIKPIDPRQIIINILGLCIFPFVARPIIQKVFFSGDELSYQQFLSDRKTEVYHFIYNSIKA
ncbi:MAG: TetR/AcrR family transcriptional regulator [Bacteroidales bacterium]|nr:TetR/AcrR family transcriptional regulator [Bacteroidales bacterium]